MMELIVYFYIKYFSLVVCGDFSRMSEMFKENKFDIVIEKAGLDSLTTRECIDNSDVLKHIYDNIYTILKPGGYVLSFSIRNPG